MAYSRQSKILSSFDFSEPSQPKHDNFIKKIAGQTYHNL